MRKKNNKFKGNITEFDVKEIVEIAEKTIGKIYKNDS